MRFPGGPWPTSLKPFTLISYEVRKSSLLITTSVLLLVTFFSVYNWDPRRLYLMRYPRSFPLWERGGISSQDMWIAVELRGYPLRNLGPSDGTGELKFSQTLNNTKMGKGGRKEGRKEGGEGREGKGGRKERMGGARKGERDREKEGRKSGRQGGRKEGRKGVSEGWGKKGS